MELFLSRTTVTLSRPAIVGVLNVTPDSFFAGSRVDAGEVAARASAMVRDGADILDIGGESTGPGSSDVSLKEELARVLPAVQAVRAALPSTIISVDTYKSAVAEEAIAAGANIINDVTAGRGDAEMFRVLAEAGTPCILMYGKDPTPRTTVAAVSYDDVIATIRQFLEDRIDRAEKAGIDRRKIIIDPGLGHFVSSNADVSMEILSRLHELADLAPILVSPSRKSFLAGPSALPVAERLPATLAAVSLAAMRGASFIRTHDIAKTKHTLDALREIL